jgi:divinyl chlorophyllide a 8-vinyl-reductase
MSLRHDYRSRPPEQVRVVVFGATGYIGRFVVKELVERGYQVIAFARERSGIGGRQSKDEVIADFPELRCASGMSPIQPRSQPRPSINPRMWW